MTKLSNNQIIKLYEKDFGINLCFADDILSNGTNAIQGKRKG